MKLGLTGGIGCGKSTALAYLRALGWQTVQTDAQAKALLDEDPQVRQALAQQWPEVLDEQGTIDKSQLAGIIFTDESALRWLENLLHPKVRLQWQQWLTKNQAHPCAVEIPLLFEKGLETEFDATVCIAASDSAVIERMRARGFSAEQVNARAAHQWPLQQKIEAADYVIWNDGTEAFLEKQLTLLNQIVTTRNQEAGGRSQESG